MFVLQPKPTFKVPVSIPTPSGVAGKFTVEFRHKGRKAFREFVETFTADKEGDVRSDADALDEIIADWKGVDAPYSKEALETLLDNFPAAARELFSAYNAALFEGKVDNQAAKN